MAGVVVETTGGNQGRPSAHSAGVVMTAFGFVPRIAAFAIVTAAGSGNDFETFGMHVFEDHVRGGDVFEAGPSFGEIGKWNARATAFGIAADKQRGFVVQDVGALDAIVLGERFLEVVFVDGLRGRGECFRA